MLVITGYLTRWTHLCTNHIRIIVFHTIYIIVNVYSYITETLFIILLIFTLFSLALNLHSLFSLRSCSALGLPACVTSVNGFLFFVALFVDVAADGGL